MAHILHWKNPAQTAIGSNQSPIVIVSKDAKYDRELENNQLRMRYIQKDCKEILNNGYTVQVNVNGLQSVLIGGPVKEYRSLIQFHFHWGAASHLGSEHHVDDKVYAAELHLVHWNSSKYSSIEEAVSQPDGLTVLAVFLEASNESHPGLQELINYFPLVTYDGDQTSIPSGFDPSVLLPADLSKYWTYAGSLTTPPFYESVRFIIFKDPIRVSEDQLNVFRNLRCGTRLDEVHGSCCHLVNNFRTCMPLNGREVKSTFRKFFA